MTLSLYPFQKEAVSRMVSFLNSPSSGVYNAAEMRLGKCAMTIKAIESHNKKLRVAPKILFICPAVVRLVWEDELRKWSASSHVYNTVVLESSKTIIPINAQNVIVSYTLAAKPTLAKRLAEMRFDYLVLDEAHMLRNDSQRSRTIFSLIWPFIKYRIALSGTPLVNGALDGYNLFHAFLPDEPSFHNKSEYCKNYVNKVRCPFTPTGWKWDKNSAKNTDQLKQIITDKFYIRYRRREVAKEVPPVQIQKVLLPESFLARPSNLGAYGMPSLSDEEAMSLMRQQLEAIRTGKAMPPNPHLMTLRRFQGLKKIPAIVEFVSNLLDQNTPTVLVSCFTEFMQTLATDLHKYSPALISGETPMDARKQAIESFQEARTNLIQCNIQAGGIGINLSRSNTMVLGEYSYNPSELDQVICRCISLSKLEPIVVYVFCVQGSIDEEIWNAVSEKINITNAIVN